MTFLVTTISTINSTNKQHEIYIAYEYVYVFVRNMKCDILQWFPLASNVGLAITLFSSSHS
jgi:F0F1-type ATP synthase membrane subunit a